MSRASFAVIFDWDGVIVNSSRSHELSWERLAAEEGRVLPAGHFQRGFGMKNETIIPTLLGWTSDLDEIRRLSDRKEVLYRQLIRETGVQAVPGVAAFLHTLTEADVPYAVGSSTPRRNILCALEQLGLPASFEVIVSSEDVIHGKPDPEIFLKAAQRLQMSPLACLVIEDTPVGLRAARAAGMKSIGVTTTHSAAMLKDADRIVQRLDSLAVEELRQWWHVLA